MNNMEDWSPEIKLYYKKKSKVDLIGAILEIGLNNVLLLLLEELESGAKEKETAYIEAKENLADAKKVLSQLRIHWETENED